MSSRFIPSKYHPNRRMHSLAIVWRTGDKAGISRCRRHPVSQSVRAPWSSTPHRCYSMPAPRISPLLTDEQVVIASRLKDTTYCKRRAAPAKHCQASASGVVIRVDSVLRMLKHSNYYSRLLQPLYSNSDAALTCLF